MRTLKDKRAVSPVIATVILVAVAITVAVAVAYWMGGIAGMYTKFEKVEILSAYAPLDTDNHLWNVTLVLKNTGSAEATIIGVYINNMPIDQFQPSDATPVTWAWNDPSNNSAYTPLGYDDSITIESGQQVTVYLIIKDPSQLSNPNYNFSSGTTINVKLHSAGGMDYVKLVELT
ncbi:hypothetical protein CW700_02260 [Candidatus Bathyarchaeota archaeon]|nr:MAG: hypothetical protein CW700_02260 [Candidatus Bathyarchaeota archaeon]